MKPINKWKVFNSDDEILGIFEGHIIDVIHKVSGVPDQPLYIEPTKEEPKEEIIFPPAAPIVRFFLGGVKKEIMISPPHYRDAWFQSMFLESDPIHQNWLVVQTGPYVKVEFI